MFEQSKAEPESHLAPVQPPLMRIAEAGDHAALLAFLQRHADSSLFLLANIQGSGISRDGPKYAIMLSADELVGVASYTPAGMLLLQVPGVAPGSLARSVWRAAAAPLRGLLGPTDQVAQVQRELGLEREPERFHSDEILYALDLGSAHLPRVEALISVRVAAAEDIDVVADFRLRFHVEALGVLADDPTLIERSRAEAKRMCSDGKTFLLFDDHVPVAMTLFNAHHLDVVQVGGVFTLEERRSHGYGRKVVAASLLHAVREWSVRRAVLFTAEQNRPAQRAYEALGFRRIGSYTLHFFRDDVLLQEAE